MLHHFYEYLIHGYNLKNLIRIAIILKNGFRNYQMYLPITFIIGLNIILNIPMLNMFIRLCNMMFRKQNLFVHIKKYTLNNVINMQSDKITYVQIDSRQRNKKTTNIY